MEASQFLSALLAIIVIDIVLAGDNAVVIALAARSLPPVLQRRAIVWGAVGAIAVRSLMTVIVVWLLKIPGLLLAGGLMLIWIAYRLLLPEEGKDSEGKPAVTTFWGAMYTIVVADAVMGLDNVLAVAGAAHGSYLLVIVGLAISVPIVVWGSTLVLRLVDRFPSVVYIGAGVLVWTAVKMIAHEPLIASWLVRAPLLAHGLLITVPVVLWMGFVKNHRSFESRIHARLAVFANQRPVGESSPVPPPDRNLVAEGGKSMLKILVPVDGSPNALHAVRHAIAEYRRHHELELHLFNVQPSLSRHVARFVARADRHAWHAERALAAMADAAALLEAAGVPHHTHWAVGDDADEISRAARDLGVHHIVMGTARKSSITRMLEDSVTNKVLETTPVPVEVIAGDAVSTWERWGIPPAAGSAAGGLLALALD